MLQMHRSFLAYSLKQKKNKNEEHEKKIYTKKFNATIHTKNFPNLKNILCIFFLVNLYLTLFLKIDLFN